MASFRWFAVGLVLIAGCGRGGDAMNQGQSAGSAIAQEKLEVTSSAFAEGHVIPKEHTGEGSDRSPALSWSGAPNGTKEFAIVVHDPDAPAGTWYHWVLYNLPADVTSLPEGLPKDPILQTPVKARQGLSSWASQNVGYRGPMPPSGHGRHRYMFTVYALDTHIELEPDLAAAQALHRKMSGHVLAEGTLTGYYERK